MESNANEAALAKLNEMSGQFAARQQDFGDLAMAYRLHAASFQTVGGSVGRVAHLIELNQRFDLESKSATELQTELGKIDDVLGKTFESLPDDLTPIFATPGKSDTKPAPSGIWERLRRFLGLAGESKNQLATSNTEGQ
jgi:hypothetical protein